MKKFSYFTRKSKTNHRTINRQFELARTKSYSMTCFFLKRRNLEFRVLSIIYYSCSLQTASLFTDPLFSFQSLSSAGNKINHRGFIDCQCKGVVVGAEENRQSVDIFWGN